MTVTLSNTLTGETTAFEPVTEGRVSIYYCGLTVSDDAHLGHARSWVHTDVIRRWFEHLGYTVDYAENFTDINEKIVARIGEHGEDEAAVARHFIDRVLGDMRALNLKRATVYPRVSEHLPEIIGMIERLIERDHAYESNGSVYFDVTTYSKYGTLSNQSIDEMESQAEHGPATEKRHPQDFALWKAGAPAPAEIEDHQPADPPISAEEATAGACVFDSPWGSGRPGWHIECSAMSTAHLGDSFDIHLAGHDILFPHNENEIAQSEAATGQPFATYWLHTGMLRTAGEKMSSSLQNFFRVRDAVAEYGPNVIRTFYLSAKYSADQQFSAAAIEEATERWERIDRAYERAKTALDSVNARTKVTDEGLRSAVESAESAITAAMNDDFNTRVALAGLLDLAGAIHRHIDASDEYDYIGLKAAIERFETYGSGVFGFQFVDTDGTADVDELIDLMLAVREEAREAGSFALADAIRDGLAEHGIEVQDTGDGPTYRQMQ